MQTNKCRTCETATVALFIGIGLQLVPPHPLQALTQQSHPHFVWFTSKTEEEEEVLPKNKKNYCWRLCLKVLTLPPLWYLVVCWCPAQIVSTTLGSSQWFDRSFQTISPPARPPWVSTLLRMSSLCNGQGKLCSDNRSKATLQKRMTTTFTQLIVPKQNEQ